MPAARATTFLSAAPSSMPSTSGLVYTRNTSLMNTDWINSAVFLVFAPTTIVVGMHLPTSSAWEGPDKTATSACGISSSITCESVISEDSSIPFATFTMICPSATHSFMLHAVALVNEEGTASTRISFSFTASASAVVNTISSASFTPGSLSLCSCSLSSMSISSFNADHTVMSCPLLCSSTVSAIPQLPAPIIPILAIWHTTLSFIASFCRIFSLHLPGIIPVLIALLSC